MAPAARRVGVLGGTFDPIHIGHLVAALEVRHALALDAVLLVVANEPWQKVGVREISPAADRLAVVDAAVEGIDGIEASGVEIARGGATYTADTLAELSRAEPGAELHLVVGTDVARELGTWMRLDEIRAAIAGLVVVGRPGASSPAGALDEAGWSVTEVPIPALEVSSTDLRARVAEGRPIDFLIPPGAVREIRERGLYARP